MRQNAVFSTERLIIRRATTDEGDINLLFDLWNNPKVMTMVGFPKGLAIKKEDIIKTVESYEGDDPYNKYLIVERKEDQVPIGECKLGAVNKELTVDTDVKLLPNFWGNKYGVEIKHGLVDYLFNHTNCERIEATPNKKNVASIKMQEAVGGSKVDERVFKAPAEAGDFRTDVHALVYHVTRQTWQQRQKESLSSIEVITNQFNHSYALSRTQAINQFEPAVPLIEQSISKFARLLDMKSPPAKILDLACGTGMMSVVLAKQGYDVTAMDCSFEGLKTGQEIAKRMDVKIDWQQTDMRSFVTSEPFDYIFLYDVIFGSCNTHTENEMVLTQIAKALKKGGRCLLEVYNKEFAIKNSIENKFFFNQEDDWFYPDPENLALKDRKMQLFSHKEWQEILPKHGFKIISLAEQGWHWKNDSNDLPFRGEFIIMERL